MQLLLDRETAALLVHARPPLVRLAAAPAPAPAAPPVGARRLCRFARDSGRRRVRLALDGRRRGRVAEIALVNPYAFFR